jgi:hypothetical protein
MTTITTRTDLITYLQDTRADLAEHGLTERVADYLQDADHPAWGEDWQEWLDAREPYLAAWLQEATESTYTITASDPTPTEFDVEGGIDVDVQIETADDVVVGQVTLAPDQYSGRMGSWGDRDMWVSGSLCTWIDSRWPRGPEQRQILDEIEAAAVAAL